MADTTDTPTASSKKQKVTVTLNGEMLETVTELAEKLGISVGDVLRRGIAIETFIEAEIADGGELLIRKNGELERLTLLYT